MHSFPSFEPVHCLTSGFKCCFLTCIQASQEESKVVWYCYHFKYFPQFVVIHTVNEAEVDFFFPLWNSLALSMIQQMLAIWSLVPLPFQNPACTFGSSQFTYCWSLAWRILSITLLACEMRAILWYWTLFGIVLLWDWNENWPFTVLWPLWSFPNLLAYWVHPFHNIIF